MNNWPWRPPDNSREIPPARRDHHGRQRALGGGARTAAHGRPPRRPRRGGALRWKPPSEQGIRVLTLFTFSTDNWGRPESEVAELMRIFEDFFRVDAPALAARGVRVTVIGRRDRLPNSLREAIEEIETASEAGGQLHVRSRHRLFRPGGDSPRRAPIPTERATTPPRVLSCLFGGSGA
jgi:hypothetical protein